MPYLLKYATASQVVRIPVRKINATDFATSSDWTPAAGDVKVSKDGGSQANIGSLPTYSNGSWEFTFTGTELTAKRIEVRIVDAATKAISDDAISIETYGHASALYPAIINAGTAGNPVAVGDDVNAAKIGGTTQTAGVDLGTVLPTTGKGVVGGLPLLEPDGKGGPAIVRTLLDSIAEGGWQPLASIFVSAGSNTLVCTSSMSATVGQTIIVSDGVSVAISRTVTSVVAIGPNVTITVDSDWNGPNDDYSISPNANSYVILISAPGTAILSRAVAGDAMTLTEAYDAAKAAASQSSMTTLLSRIPQTLTPEVGTGDTPVDHNTGGTDALRYGIGGLGQDDVRIQAFLKSDYDAGVRTVQATAWTGPDGRWLEPMMLNAGVAYTLVAQVSGMTGAAVTVVTP